MKVLITGSTGFVGKKLTERFTLRDEVYHTIDRNYLVRDNKGCLIGKISEKKFYKYFDSVVHLASHLTSQNTPADTKDLVNSNIVYGSMILSHAIIREEGIFIDFGSFAELHSSNVYNINYLYTETKRSFENIAKYFCRIQNVYYTKIIPYTLYSEVDQKTKLIDLIFNSFRENKRLALSSGKQTLDFIHVDDLVDLTMTILEYRNYKKLESKIIECGTGHGTPIQHIAAMLEEISGQKSNIIWDTKNDRDYDIYYAKADTFLANSLFGWQPKKVLKNTLEKRWNDR